MVDLDYDHVPDSREVPVRVLLAPGFLGFTLVFFKDFLVVSVKEFVVAFGQ